MFLQKYTLKSELWLWNTTKGGWHFLTINLEFSQKIKEIYGSLTGGFGSIPVVVTLGKSTWKTSIFPSKELGYLLLVKKQIRDKEKIQVGDMVKFTIEIQ